MWILIVLVAYVALVALLIVSLKKDCKAIKGAKQAIQAAVSDGTGSFEAEQAHQEQAIKMIKRKGLFKVIAVVVLSVVAYIVI